MESKQYLPRMWGCQCQSRQVGRRGSGSRSKCCLDDDDGDDGDNDDDDGDDDDAHCTELPWKWWWFVKRLFRTDLG